MNRSANYLHSKSTPSRGSGFAVYHCGQKVFVNASAAICRNYIKQNNLKNASVGYA